MERAEDVGLVFALRTKCVRGIKSEFGGMFSDNNCPIFKSHIDTLSALLSCEKLKHVPRNGAKCCDVFAQNVQAHF